MTITKQRWAEIESELDRQYSKLAFKADGYVVSAGLERNKNRLLIVVYVNGSIKGAWYPRRGQPMAEEARRFWRHTIKPVASQKFIKDMEKIFGKRDCKARGLYDKWTFAEPFHLSAKAFISHLRKHNTEIEEMPYADFKAFLEDLKTSEQQPTAAA